MMKSRIAIAAILALCALCAMTAEARDRNQVRHFRASHPCPATGKTKGACPNFVVDHRVALCVHGPDTPANMKWMTVAAAKAKDRWECKPGWEKKLAECEASGCFVEAKP